MKRWADNVTAILPERLLHAYVDVLLSPAKRRAVQRALIRQPELQDTVEVWRKQNADFRRLALLETPGPMPIAMAGVTHRLETRLCRFAPLEGLRIAAVVALLLSGVAGTALMTQAQLNKDNNLISFSKNAAEANQAITKPIPTSPQLAETASPEPVVETVVVTVESPADVLKQSTDVPTIKTGRHADEGKRQDGTQVAPDTSTPVLPDQPDPTPSVGENSEPVEPPRDI